MKVTKEQFVRAAADAGLSSEQSAELWVRLDASSSAGSSFKVAHIAYYFGALIVIGAMGWFMTLGWEQFGGWGIAVTAASYGGLFLLVGERFWRTADTRIPGGLLVTIAVCMTPLAVYGVERALGFWPQGDPGVYRNFHPYIRGSWVAMELATVVAGLVALRFFAFPFLTAPITYALWYMSMDITPLLFGKDHWEWREECIVSAVFGSIVLFISYYLDGRTVLDYSFWGYLFGTMTFWGGLSAMDSGSELSKFFYLLINLAMIVTSGILQRKVFIVFGSLGVFGYLSHLAYSVFKDSIMFPFVLSVMGVLVIYSGLKYQQNQLWFDCRMREIFGGRLRGGAGPSARH